MRVYLGPFRKGVFPKTAMETLCIYRSHDVFISKNWLLRVLGNRRHMSSDCIAQLDVGGLAPVCGVVWNLSLFVVVCVVCHIFRII